MSSLTPAWRFVMANLSVNILTSISDFVHKSTSVSTITRHIVRGFLETSYTTSRVSQWPACSAWWNHSLMSERSIGHARKNSSTSKLSMVASGFHKPPDVQPSNISISYLMITKLRFSKEPKPLPHHDHTPNITPPSTASHLPPPSPHHHYQPP